MKKYTFLLAIVFTVAGLSAQAPEKMSYQAVVRDAANKLVTNHTVSMRISLLQTSATGSVVYKETQTPTSNGNGLISIEVGTGTTTDVFTAIDWSKGPYFLKTDIDPAGGTVYSITSTTQLLSVPYALYAKNVQNKQWTETGNDIYFDKGKVGIGTKTPSVPLEVVSDGIPHIKLKNIAPNVGNVQKITFWKADTEKFAIGYDLWGTGENLFTLYDTPNANPVLQIFNGKVGIGKNPGGDLRQFQVVSGNYQAVAANNNSTYSTIYASNDGTGAAGEFRNHIKIVDGTQGAGKVLTSDINGNSSWQTPSGSKWETSGSNIYYNTGKVGIGANPGADARQFQVITGNNQAVAAVNNSTSFSTIYANNEGSGADANFINNGTTYTLYAQNSGTGPAAYFDGSLQVAGGNTAEINRNQTGSANIVAICYGSVEANGTINTGGSTANFTVSKLTTGIYDITITGETYSQSTHCAIASLGDAGFVNSNAVSGKLRVYTYSTSYVATDREFSFVVFKP